jgi:hypothetical protein
MPPLSTEAPAVLDPDVEVTGEKGPGSSGPRIRCPLCGWSPRQHDRWMCKYGHHWNAFDSRGVCPA